jgi:hypothetical protein
MSAPDDARRLPRDGDDYVVLASDRRKKSPTVIGVPIDGAIRPNDPLGIMASDDQSPWSSTSGSFSETVRRQVVEAAADILHGTSDADVSDGGPAGGSRFAADPSDQSAMTLYLALLQDRLPVYARTMKGLDARVGQASVAQNLFPVAQATIDFYSEILAAKVSVFAKPDQLLQLRRVLKARDLGPHAAHEAVAGYLDKERRLGRVATDVDCSASAQLLIGACVNYAFTKMLLDDVPPHDLYITEVVHGLRLTS